jgi:hypothetical protein
VYCVIFILSNGDNRLNRFKGILEVKENGLKSSIRKQNFHTRVPRSCNNL